MIDPFGNQNRYFASIQSGVEKLLEIKNSDNTEMVKRARKYAESRTWDIPAKQLEAAVARIIENGQNNPV